jgi:isoleucyl-tRNA synthetase
VATNGYAPYKTVLTHGFVLDEKGQKMSKSLGNIVDPMVIINGGKDQKKEPPYGADVIRLWAASVDYSGDVPIGKTILAQMSDMSRKIRNTARFLLSNLFDFDPTKDAVPYAELSESDRYILHRLAEVTKDITEAYEKFQFFHFFQTIQNFCTVDLSNFYLDIAKDRLYISAANAPRRRSCQTVLMYCLETITKAIAPVLSHTAEDIWQHLPYPASHKSVFQSGWFVDHEEWHKPELADKWHRLRIVRAEVNRRLEAKRQEKMIGASLESKIKLEVTFGTIQKDLLSLDKDHDLEDLFICSRVEFVVGLPENPRDFILFVDMINGKLRESGNNELKIERGSALSTDQDDKNSQLWRDLFDPSRVEDMIADDKYRIEGVKIIVEKADGEKCPRCYNYSTRIGESTEHPHICDRCVGALAGTF